MSEMINYKKLLLEYMKCVRAAEGDTFVAFIEANFRRDFAEEEMSALKRMDADIEAHFKNTGI